MERATYGKTFRGQREYVAEIAENRVGYVGGLGRVLGAFRLCRTEAGDLWATGCKSS